MKQLLLIMCLFVALGATAQGKKETKKEVAKSVQGKYSSDQTKQLSEALDALKEFNKAQEKFTPHQKLLQETFLEEIKADSILVVDKIKLKQPYVSEITVEGKKYMKVTQMYEETQKWVQKPADEKTFMMWLSKLSQEIGEKKGGKR